MTASVVVQVANTKSSPFACMQVAAIASYIGANILGGYVATEDILQCLNNWSTLYIISSYVHFMGSNLSLV